METYLVMFLFFLVWWLGAASGLASIASRRGFDYTGWFFIGALFGPVIGALYLIASPPFPPEPSREERSGDVLSLSER